MPVSVEFIFTIIGIIVFLLVFTFMRGDFAKYRKRVLGVIVGFIALFGILSMTYAVPVSNVGIVTSFNAPTGRVTGSGLKFVLPWQRVADFDASKQLSDHTGKDLTAKNCSPGITVRIGSLATACVEARIQWQVLDPSAPKLFKDYRGKFERLESGLVETQIHNTVNAVFATYNPLSQVNLQTGQVQFDGTSLAKEVENKLRVVIGNDIRILFVAIPFVHHDEQTEANIRQFQDVIAQSRILDQKSKNAAKEKSIADQQRVYLTDQFIQNKCIEESVKMGVPPGLCLVGGGALVTTSGTR